ncbi:glycosyltransferase [Catenovulum sp. SM1970]|uniref:MJ1255/VC2487 family glycosyltransferase n=1 Tax=Marinifaba aquimaris TaxID=2741323 RepID=UPI001573427E|nr:MJ1255/VC2487 family glycosyltransferase [Marinifaba aquimaris]NTS77227.1 glycosyltransferase [Marinifaba aquimaris]
MKILYGVQGTGNGHISRARIMAKCFNKLGVDVDYIFSGRASDKYFDMQEFGNYRNFQGMSFSSKSGEVKVFDTLRQVKLGQFWQDVNNLDLSQYDVVLNDFEPVTAWAARRQNKASIAISHQASFNYPVPMQGAKWTDKQLLRYFAPANVHLGVHWYHFGHTIMPPFIEPFEASANKQNKILVYLPFESLNQVTQLLTAYSDYEFYCYHPDADDHTFDNVHYRALSRDGFKRDLTDCAGIIANAGFELSSEAIFLGKRLLLKPLNGQFEQSSNAHTLDMLGLATTMESLDSESVDLFLQGGESGKVIFPSDPKPVVDWLHQGDWYSPNSLVNELWQQVEFPTQVSDRLKRLKFG